MKRVYLCIIKGFVAINDIRVIKLFGHGGVDDDERVDLDY